LYTDVHGFISVVLFLDDHSKFWTVAFDLSCKQLARSKLNINQTYMFKYEPNPDFHCRPSSINLKVNINQALHHLLEREVLETEIQRLLVNFSIYYLSVFYRNIMLILHTNFYFLESMIDTIFILIRSSSSPSRLMIVTIRDSGCSSSYLLLTVYI
jgi:hypothetical protein